MKYILFVLVSLVLSNVLYAQNLKISSNQRYLTDENGKPFFWLGDTAWELFHKLNINDSDYYLRTRAAQGFSVIQATLLAEDDGLKKPNANGDVPFIDLDPNKPNEPYFRHVDEVIRKANKLNLVMAILPTWGDKVISDRLGNGPIIFNKTNAYFYGRFLGKRYKNDNVVWILGGDRNPIEESIEIWRAMAKGLTEGDGGRHLITYHPAGEQSSSDFFHNEPWLDFNIYQTGHAKKHMEVYHFAKKDYDKTPTKPFLDAEPCYEDIPVAFWNYMNFDTEFKVHKTILNNDNSLKDTAHFKLGFFGDYDVRLAAYRNILAGACGFTYGHNAVWQMFEKNSSFVIPCITDWKESLQRPGAVQLQHLIKLFKTIPFNELKPDNYILAENSAIDSLHIVASSTMKHSLIYLPKGGTITLKAHQFKKLRWYNPRNGEFTKWQAYSKFQSTSLTSPTKGDKNDWVLILKDKDKLK
ncbi:apiosidase-like domain-containing protein [Pedobacter helvus]|uniref:DUF4038 domain-containing protein n=1 Tax=Pedobacter helvus TaxID=2563444 RepID=A0ABW9JJ62_9SPHI|nr:DUF4038 domain-containing protein [Pedobacter ureilyticus]